MSQHPRKPTRRKNSCEFYDSIKPPSNEEGDKDLCLFHEDNRYKPEYLEMPIKIESDLPSSRRPQDYSNESSQHLQSQDMFSEAPGKNHFHSYLKDNLKDDYEELMNPHKADAIDSLLMPFSQNYSYNINDVNQYLFQDPLEIKEEPLQAEYKIFSSPKEEEALQLRSLEDSHRSFLMLFNHFRSFAHATTVAMNYHKLAKKGVLTKDHSSVFNLLSKEIKKLQSSLESQQLRFCSKIQEEKKRISDEGKGELILPKDLARTHQGCIHESARPRQGKAEEHPPDNQE